MDLGVCPQPKTPDRLTAAEENQMSEAAIAPGGAQPHRLVEGHRSSAELPQFSA